MISTMSAPVPNSCGAASYRVAGKDNRGRILLPSDASRICARIEPQRHSAKRPVIFVVTRQVGVGSSGAKGARSKYLLRRSRRCNRTRYSRAFNPARLSLRACAVSSIESPSTSRSTKTVRNIGRTSSTVLARMSPNSNAQHSCSGFGLLSRTSPGSAPKSYSNSSSRETSLGARCFRSFISNWFTVIRVSHLEDCASSLNSRKILGGFQERFLDRIFGVFSITSDGL